MEALLEAIQRGQATEVRTTEGACPVAGRLRLACAPTVSTPPIYTRRRSCWRCWRAAAAKERTHRHPSPPPPPPPLPSLPRACTAMTASQPPWCRTWPAGSLHNTRQHNRQMGQQQAARHSGLLCQARRPSRRRPCERHPLTARCTGPASRAAWPQPPRCWLPGPTPAHRMASATRRCTWPRRAGTTRCAAACCTTAPRAACAAATRLATRPRSWRPRPPCAPC